MSEKLGLRQGAKSPGSITNVQHHDASGGQKNVSASPSLVEKIIAPSTTAAAVEDESVVRAVNNSASLAYIWFGQQADVPVTVDATNGIPMPANSVENFLVGRSNDDKQSMMVKTSAATVLVLQYKSKSA